ncbi:hypothetical protein C8F04DRAFT_1221063 [Mycena alexandri]|uniref:GDP-fucose protein O-fucosyltransferase 2 n=1 Tax=Mycena alexandri TaxID=1745969 RepID=A0AAD6SXT5_9AGAR|nr:hypothetical protein C8F04DRAFT_1221063 [Mycena alexandri]
MLMLAQKAWQLKHWIIALVILQAVVCTFFLQSRLWEVAHSQCAPAFIETVPVFNIPLLATAGPTARFRENLRADVKYITSWPANGWSNQVIEFMNLIYLARLTERVPIVPRFRPVHIEGDNVSHVDFSNVFDLPRLQNELRTPILEWRDVKDVASDIFEDLGCWDIQHKTWKADSNFLEPPADLHLDISYTPAPMWVFTALRTPTERNDRSMLLWPLASLIAFNKRATSLEVLPKPVLSPIHQTVHPPDDHLFCTNKLYFGLHLLESAQDLSPAWQDVGRHMHWTPALEEIAVKHTRQTLGLEPEAEIPPYIAVHVRRRDFSIWCNIDRIPLDKCFPPVSAYERQVHAIQIQIFEDKGVSADRVIITSDERDPEWWESVLELGWVSPDHSQTAEVHGPWYPIFIDAVIHGAAEGFVGTDTSTVSILARRRVSSRGGVAEMVTWVAGRH